MFEPVILSIAVLGGLGALFGVMLGVASKKFAVEKDERIDQILEFLPGANCGGCGFPGCGGFAEAVVKGEVEVSGCAVVSKENAKVIGGIMGVDVGDIKPRVARIMCVGSQGKNIDKFLYDGPKDCRAAAATAKGHKACRFACLGLGTCAKVCKFGAIKMGANGIAFIDEDKCTGCGRCVEQCPQNTIAVMEKEIDVYTACKNQDKGKPVTQVCSIGCIGCGVCAKKCPFEAITMENNLPVIDKEKCRDCRVCVEVCPRGCMIANHSEMRAVIMEEKCVGCTLCKKACPFEAIEGELREKHRILDQCRGCGICVSTCRREAIELVSKEPEQTMKKIG